MSTMIGFVYWFKDEYGKVHRIYRDSYVGDCGDPISYMGKTYVITDWTYEELDRG